MMGKIIKNKKYLIERIWLICINGISISWAPAQVNRIKLLINIQYNNWIKGENINEGMLILSNGKK